MEYIEPRRQYTELSHIVGSHLFLFSSNCKVKSLLYQADCSFLGEVFREVRGAHFVVDGEGYGGS